MDITTITHDGLTFRVTKEHDHDAAAPWTDHGHGPVRHTYARSEVGGYSAKRAGELRLVSRGGWLYDYADACKTALADGWNGCRNREEAAQAARDDYEQLRQWVAGEWCYYDLTVTLLDVEGNPTDAQQYLGRIDDNGDEIVRTAEELAAQCVLEIGENIDYTDDGIRYTSGARSWIVSRELPQLGEVA